ncbi:prepilin-type N-terminal cleavage/methylation domain-containing protein [Sulfuricurvum sp.]|uniref:type IV pilin protein n=1 Tax=Sulfuricurvum sp. TaxID=2025608 RepID=UPI00286E4B4B|nr:prepilin-type N-terminal cleavage/methylation domain-containing protein [Sulfuricurvum sp.]
MTQKYTGMRKGISLVEMVIAIVLFAALAAIGLKYAKSYLNTDLQAKKARVAALTDQANQLVQAYTIYRNETGLDPSSITELNGTSGILNAIPTVITEISTTGWELNTSTGMEGTGVAFQVRIDLNGTTTPTNSDEQYCAVFNREFNTSTELNVTDQQTFGGADINATRAMYGNFFCYSRSTGDNWIMIVVP